MKLVLNAVLTTALATALQLDGPVGHAALPQPELIHDTPEVLFAPPGFDSNDHAQVVLSGSFMNSCYKVGPGRAEVDAATRTIRITQQAYVTDSSWCLQVLVPYTSVVDVGILPEGNYSILVRTSDTTVKPFGSLSVARAAYNNPNAPDELLYAIVDELGFENDVLTLKGRLPGGCTRLKEVRTLMRKTGIVEVLPLVELTPSNGALECSRDLVPFERRIPLTLPWSVTTLFHARSLNGQAVNRVVERRN